MLRDITIKTIGGATFTATDTADDSSASLILGEFKRGGIMCIADDDDTYFVPASAVDNIKVSIVDESE